MGYAAPLDFQDRAEDRWIGEHRPELVDLSAIFAGLVALDVTALEVGPTAVLEAWRAVLPRDVQLIRVLSPRTVQVHVAAAPLVRDLVLKVMPPRPRRGLRAWTGRLEGSRSRRAHLWAHRLRALGIDTPRPLGFIEKGLRRALSPSFTAAEYVLAPTLVEIRDAQVLGAPALKSSALAEKRALIRRVAELFRRMHAQGVFHADLHAGNLLVTEEEVLVLDLESMRALALPRRAALRNLVRLNRSFLDTRAVTRTDRLRFLLTYLRHVADRPARLRALWAQVRLGTERKLFDLGEAFR